MSDGPQPFPGGRRGRKARAARPATADAQQLYGLPGGAFQPLNASDKATIHDLALTLLERTGFADASADMKTRFLRAGAFCDDEDRLRLPRALVEDALAALPREFSLSGQAGEHSLALEPGRVHMGSGGAAPLILDLENGRYRPSTLADLYDAARLVDALENVHFFSRSLVARDMPDARALDINTAYACLTGTTKHVMVSASAPEHVSEIAEMCWLVAGSREAFDDAPFLSLNVNHATPPMRFSQEATDVMAKAARLGIPVHANVFSQVGASAPVSLMGAVAQATAEALAGMIYVWLVNPEVKSIFGPRPMVVDLRTGAMSGGGGEQAVIMAAAAQMGQHYGLANSTIAGASDSKLADVQSGFEKALSVALAANAGSNLITQACGMQASLMGCALESYVIDNDMLGAVLSSLSPRERISAQKVAQTIDQVARQEGHFLGQVETLTSAKSDFVYPALSDRRPIELWEADGARDLRDVAKDRTREILTTHFPGHIGDALDKELRRRFDIQLPQSRMRPSEGSP